MGKLLKYILFIFIIILSCDALAWTKINNGIEHKYFECGASKYHAVRIDPNNVNLSSAVFKPHGRFARDVITQSNADVVINGSFFTPELVPIGLIISDGIELSKIHKTSWWSIFYIENEAPKISLARDISSISNLSFAVQAGPRLIINGTIPSFKNKTEIASRSVVGIDKNNMIILAVSKSGLTNESFAKCLMNKYPKGLELIDAMNLDGGSSTQMAVKIQNEIINDAGLIPVPNYIIVKSKNKITDK